MLSETELSEQQAVKRSFVFGDPMIATARDLALHWLGGKRGEYFRCAFCGYRFQIGDRWRCQFTNDVAGAAGNPLVCERCDGPKDELIARWREMWELARGKMWRFSR